MGKVNEIDNPEDVKVYWKINFYKKNFPSKTKQKSILF